MKFALDKLPKNLVNAELQAKQLFVEQANLLLEQGSMSQAIAKASLLAEELDRKLKLEKQKILEDQIKAESLQKKLRQDLEQQQAKEQQRLRKQAISLLEQLSDEDLDEDTTAVQKSAVADSKQVIATSFDAKGRLVTELKDGTRIVSKNQAPADQINQAVTLHTNPVFDYVQMNTTAGLTAEDYLPGMLTWNEQEDCLDIIQADGTRLQTGLENYIQVVNKTASTLPNGSVVMFSGVDQNETPSVKPIVASPGTEPLYIVGVLTNELSPDELGRATVLGKVRNLNTTGSDVGEVWQQGQILWVNPTMPGKFTNKRPIAPDIAISVAAVLKVHATEGLILVRPTIWPRMFYGKFRSTQSQVPAAINTPYAVTFNQTDFSSGVSLSNSSRVLCSNQGLYSFDFRMQVTSSNSSKTNIYIWARINGIDVNNTTTVVSAAGNGYELSPSWNFVLSMNAGDYFELMYAVDATAVSISAPPATAFCPSTPSVVMKVNQVNL